MSLLRRPQARTQAQGFTATSTHSKLKAKELGVREILLVPRGPLAPPAQLEHPGLACGPRALDPRTPNASPLPVSPSHSIKHADLLGLAQAWQSERNTRHTIISVGGFGMLGQPELPGVDLDCGLWLREGPAAAWAPFWNAGWGARSIHRATTLHRSSRQALKMLLISSPQS